MNDRPGSKPKSNRRLGTTKHTTRAGATPKVRMRKTPKHNVTVDRPEK